MILSYIRGDARLLTKDVGHGRPLDHSREAMAVSKSTNLGHRRSRAPVDAGVGLHVDPVVDHGDQHRLISNDTGRANVDAGNGAQIRA